MMLPASEMATLCSVQCTCLNAQAAQCMHYHHEQLTHRWPPAWPCSYAVQIDVNGANASPVYQYLKVGADMHQ